MLIYWLWFSLLPDLSGRQKMMLLERIPDPEDIYRLEQYEDLELTPEQEQALSNKDLHQAQTIEKICMRKGIGILAFSDERYPDRLRNIDSPPLVLYYKGVLPDFDRQPAIGIVGTRKASAYGLNTARQFGKQIALSGGVVVSGGAAGVDSMALQGARESDGQTVTVLGCGVDITYPAKNRRLFMDLTENGCLLSEYIPGDGPERWHFPARNRIISGLSNGVLIVEAPVKSGALITAKDALEQGRDVYVVPGNIDIPTCQGSNALLREGAVAAFSGWDILKEYQMLYPETVKEHKPLPPKAEIKAAQEAQLPQADKKGIDKQPTAAYSGKDNNRALTSEEESILACLDVRPKPVDDVIAQVGEPASRVLSVLTKLALKGMVINHPGRLVSVRKQ